MSCTANRRAAARASIAGVDVVVNYTGGDTWTKSLRVLRVGGRLADLRRDCGL